MPDSISLVAARRIAVAATGLAEARPAGDVTGRHLRRVISRLGLLQIDSVSVLARAHYLPLFSRLGPYAMTLLDEAAWGKRRALFEYWAHEASFVPMEMQPLLRWRMAGAEAGIGLYSELAGFARERRETVEAVFARVQSSGPTACSDLDDASGAGGWWGWSDSKRALEILFWTGRLTTATRRGFERLYDLPERVLPAAVLAAPTPSPADARRALLQIGARALGVMTASDLRDYHRMSPQEGNPGIADLVEMGELVPVRVESWTQQAYVHRDARWPRRVDGCALLAPFDPLVWHRPRTERLFDFHYRIGIYTPAARRTHGYYVLPFLLGERLVARVDLKADRAAGALQVLESHAEPGAPPHAAEVLAEELRTMARWLGLERTVVHARGGMAAGLATAMAEEGEQAGTVPD